VALLRPPGHPDDGDGFSTVVILKGFVTFGQDHEEGERLRVPVDTARKWIREGKAKYVGSPLSK
jgi:hypothetical protein